MKNMDSFASLDFVRTSRNYITLSLNTNEPQIKIRIKTSSVEKSKIFRQYLTLIIRGIVNNNIRNISRDGYDQNNIGKEWIKFFMYLIPEVRDDTLETNIDEHFFNKLSNKNKE
jgi:hypothetical protein